MITRIGSYQTSLWPESLVALGGRSLARQRFGIVSRPTPRLTSTTPAIHDQSVLHDVLTAQSMDNNCFIRRLIGKAVVNKCFAQYVIEAKHG